MGVAPERRVSPARSVWRKPCDRRPGAGGRRLRTDGPGAWRCAARGGVHTGATDLGAQLRARESHRPRLHARGPRERRGTERERRRAWEAIRVWRFSAPCCPSTWRCASRSAAPSSWRPTPVGWTVASRSGPVSPTQKRSGRSSVSAGGRLGRLGLLGLQRDGYEARVRLEAYPRMGQPQARTSVRGVLALGAAFGSFLHDMAVPAEPDPNPPEIGSGPPHVLLLRPEMRVEGIMGIQRQAPHVSVMFALAPWVVAANGTAELRQRRLDRRRVFAKLGLHASSSPSRSVPTTEPQTPQAPVAFALSARLAPTSLDPAHGPGTGSRSLRRGE